MSRTLVLLLLFLLLGGGAFWYLSQGEEEKTSLVGADREFAVELEQIHKIFIADRAGEKTTLERRDGYWLYNGKHEARPSVMRPLLEAITNVRVKYKPPTAAVKHMVNALATKGIKVELYDKEGTQLKAYYIGGSTADERGTFMILEGEEQPYVVEIPSWEGNLSVRFQRKGDEWRKKLLFEEEVENIKSVAVEYPKQRNNSFIFEQMEEGIYDVRPFYDVTPKIQNPMKAGIGESYLVQFEKVSAEAFRNNLPEKDSVRQLVPFSVITLTTVDGDTTTVKLYPIVPETVVTQDMKSGDYVINSGDIERYFVDFNGEDFMMAQNRVLKEVLWGYQSFFENRRLLN